MSPLAKIVFHPPLILTYLGRAILCSKYYTMRSFAAYVIQPLGNLDLREGNHAQGYQKSSSGHAESDTTAQAEMACRYRNLTLGLSFARCTAVFIESLRHQVFDVNV